MPAMFSSGFAVVIGVGADLPVTVGDAKGIAGMLLDRSRCAYPADQVKLLTGESARRQNILDALKWLADTAGGADTAIVYFSGHGMDNPDFHLVPYGIDFDDLPNTAISGQEFTSLLQAIRTQKLLVLLDCCHAGGQAEAKGIFSSPLPAAALGELGKGSGRVIIASSRKDELSWTGKPYSVFTLAVLEAFAGKGAFEKDGFSRVLDLAFWIARHVPDRTNDKQHPIIKVSNLEDNFAISWYAAGQAAPKELPWDTGTVVAGRQSPVYETRDAEADETRRRVLENYRDNLLLIEERISQFIDFTEIPLQLIKSRRQVERQIKQYENLSREG